MDENTILEYLEEQHALYLPLGSNELLNSLNAMEFIHIDDKKRELFFNKIEYICMSKSLKNAMERETGWKQLKRFFTDECGMENTLAQHNADKYNAGCRIYDKFPQIVKNCAQSSCVDIRDLSLNDLSLAINMSWVLRRAALSKTKSRKKPTHPDNAVDVDVASINQSVDEIRASNWYAAAKNNPALVANIMNQISETIVRDSQCTSQRH